MEWDGVVLVGIGIGVLFLKRFSFFFRFTHIVRKTALYALRHCLVGRDGKNEYPIFLFLTDTLYIVVHGRKLEPKQFMP
jgi:uncharacterized membrane protein